MKIYNQFKIEALRPQMQRSLEAYRAQRNFCAEAVIAAKTERLNAYFRESGLNAAVIAVSGGIDSALVLALLKKASEQPGSPLTKIVAVTLPATKNEGATGQDSSCARAVELGEALGIDVIVMDISAALDVFGLGIDKSMGLTSKNWAKGQLVSYLRTPALYYYTALLTDNGERSVVVGTTNADEGQYIGYIGKASDGMVDVQLISDLHKSEVYALAQILGVPESILLAIPTGDMFDSRVDEEVFGFPYGFIELYRSYQCMNAQERDVFIAALEDAGEAEDFEKLSGNVENMHKYNKHKYLGCSPAVHLDVLNTKVPRGWKYFNYGDE